MNIDPQYGERLLSPLLDSSTPWALIRSMRLKKRHSLHLSFFDSTSSMLVTVTQNGSEHPNKDPTRTRTTVCSLHDVPASSNYATKIPGTRDRSVKTCWHITRSFQQSVKLIGTWSRLSSHLCSCSLMRTGKTLVMKSLQKPESATIVTGRNLALGM